MTCDDLGHRYMPSHKNFVYELLGPTLLANCIAVSILVGVYAVLVAKWLVRSTPERVVQVRALAGDIVLNSWARHFTLTVPLSTQVYKWVPANLLLGVALRWTSIPAKVQKWVFSQNCQIVKVVNSFN